MLPTEETDGDVSVNVNPASNKTVNSQQLEGLRRTLQSLPLLTAWGWNQP